MTSDERARAAFAYCQAQMLVWDAWLARPWHERAGIQDKVHATLNAHGMLAARKTARALGMPSISDELCDPPEVLETCAAQERDEMRNAGLMEPVMRSQTPDPGLPPLYPPPPMPERPKREDPERDEPDEPEQDMPSPRPPQLN